MTATKNSEALADSTVQTEPEIPILCEAALNHPQAIKKLRLPKQNLLA